MGLFLGWMKFKALYLREKSTDSDISILKMKVIAEAI